MKPVTATTTYLRFELLRTFRNFRFLALSLVFPLVLFFVIAAPNRHAHLAGLPFPVYYMAGMVAWGAMAAVVAGGARIAIERGAGWNRQLRLTPLSSRSYIGTKMACGYGLASLSILLIYLAGVSLGVRLAAWEWLAMTGLVLVGLVPFAVLGVLLGHLVTPDSMGPAMGGLVSLLALAGGAWGPIAQSGPMLAGLKLIPSYWLVQAGSVAYGGHGWPLEGWIVVGVWTLVLARVAVRVYKRDTGKV